MRHAAEAPDIARRGPSATERHWLDGEAAYLHWRDEKLSQYEAAFNEQMTPVADLAAPTDAERAAIMARVEKTNMALYASPAGTRDDDDANALLLGLGRAFGLRALEDHRSANRNGVVRIEIVGDGGRAGYIPYTDRPISWHTDGYYNFHGPGRCVQAMILHCGRAAAEGGVNRVLDHEIAWLRLRDRDPDALRLLMHPQAMTIPESVESNGRVRPANVGPVFYVTPEGAGPGRLGMRYSARKKFISYRDAATKAAADLLLELIESEPLARSVRLRAGQGLVCNNVLHDRSAFADGTEAARLLYRIRFHGRVGAKAD
jgi:hypothetical protein